MPRNGLLSQSLATQVPSALYRFTSRFGMGLGGPGTLLPRNKSLFTPLSPPPFVGVQEGIPSSGKSEGTLSDYKSACVNCFLTLVLASALQARFPEGS